MLYTEWDFPAGCASPAPDESKDSCRTIIHGIVLTIVQIANDTLNLDRKDFCRELTSGILAPGRTVLPIIPSAVNFEGSIAVQIKRYSLPLVCALLHVLFASPVPEVTLLASACTRTQSIAAIHLHRVGFFPHL